MPVEYPSQPRIVWGVEEPKEIRGAPEGRQRLRLRKKDAGRLFVKTAQGIREFILCDAGDYWFVDYRMEQGRNHRFISPARVASNSTLSLCDSVAKPS